MSKEKPAFESSGEKTQFNSAIACLERLHELLTECNNLSRQCFFDSQGHRSMQLNSLIAWKMTLLSTFREISIKMLKKELQDIHSMFNDFDNIKILKSNNSPDVSITNFNFAWETLHNIELKLRLIADQRGMLLPNKIKDSEATEL